LGFSQERHLPPIATIRRFRGLRPEPILPRYSPAACPALLAFSTIVYLIIFGFFDRTGANVTLSLLMMLKLAFAACLILAHQRFIQNLAHQRFIQNKGPVLIILTSLAANIIISFSHAIVPVPLVSITDGIAAIVVFVLVVSWAAFFLIGSIIAVAKAVA
jgi:hypothetical protein